MLQTDYIQTQWWSSLPFSNENLRRFFSSTVSFILSCRHRGGPTERTPRPRLQPLSPVGYAYGGQNLSLDGRCFCSFRRISRFRKCHWIQNLLCSSFKSILVLTLSASSKEAQSACRFLGHRSLWIFSFDVDSSCQYTSFRRSLTIHTPCTENNSA